MTYLATLLLGLAFAPVRTAVAKDDGSSPPTRPNIILILADDLGYADIGCFGQKLIQTPQIDRMATEGMRFEQAYAGATVCAPSRCTLMTGLHNGHAPIRGNHEIKPEGQLPMPAGTYTMAQMFHDAGYATALIGKWGLGYPGSDSTPPKMGFDHFFGYNCQVQAHEYYPPHLWRNEEKVPLDGKTYSHDLFTADALAFVRDHRDRPFFLDLSYTIPHAKLQVPDLGEYATKPWPEDRKALAAMISRMDSDVGKILAALKELNIDDRTIVLFASDNGAGYNDKLFDHSGPLRGMKRDMYEGGIRTPAIVRWPGHVAPGTVSQQVWTFADLLPTFAAIIGHPARSGLDGIDVAPAWLERKAIEHPPTYFEFHERGFDVCSRRGDWKAVRKGSTGPIELYDLATDPAETHDVAADHPDVVASFDTFFRTARTPSEAWPIRDKKPTAAPAKPRA
jgi:arylsulfatase A-like enzyme